MTTLILCPLLLPGWCSLEIRDDELVSLQMQTLCIVTMVANPKVRSAFCPGSLSCSFYQHPFESPAVAPLKILSSSISDLLHPAQGMEKYPKCPPCPMGVQGGLGVLGCSGSLLSSPHERRTTGQALSAQIPGALRGQLFSGQV